MAILQNTVHPTSDLVIAADRSSSLIGNRGILHNSQRTIVKHSVGKRWICCAMAIDGIDRRPLFKTNPFSYSELFFLDEATAYASGHRPCNDCRRPALLDFKRFWGRANFPDISPSSITVTKIDSQLHLERIRKDHSKVTYPDRIGSLPTGVMFAYAKRAYLSHEGRVLEWTPSGYVRAELAADREVEVLTPRSIVEAIRLGLAVELHGSANM